MAETYMESLGRRAKAAESEMSQIGASLRNAAILAIAAGVEADTENLIRENKKDIENAVKEGKTEAFTDRLTLTEARIFGIAEAAREIAALPDPIGEVIGGSVLANGLSVVKKRVPLGTIGIIFESRPNVTVDAAALCLKSANVCILRGGSGAAFTNLRLVSVMREALKKAGLPEDAVLLVEDTGREHASEMMRLNKYIDVLIPRGGAGLIRSVVENSTVPVIETGSGNCHVYVDEFADLSMALEIADNSKTHRPSVCNAAETLLVHEKIAAEFLPMIAERWDGKVEIYGDPESAKYIKITREAAEEDYYTEYLDYKIAVKVVESLDEAARHINKYGTRHSEAIITSDYGNAARFQLSVDAAAVYVNASTRFTDGNVFGLGAEIGISNQKLHARGPMGLRELTTYKYLINGNGQVR